MTGRYSQHDINGRYPGGRWRTPTKYVLKSPLRPTERTASFEIDIERGAYHDFGSGQGGKLSELFRLTGHDDPFHGEGAATAAPRSREAENIIVQRQAALQTWKAAGEAEGHPYLLRKKVEAYRARRSKTGVIWKDGQLKELTGDFLIIPAYGPDGSMVGIEQITGEGRKFALGQRGTFILGECDSRFPLILAEGFATAASLKKITGWNVACCFGEANIRKAVESLRRQFQGDITIAPDYQSVDFVDVADVVEIPGEHPKNTDWNDLVSSLGIETAKDLFREAWAKARKKKEPTEPRQEERRSSFSLRRIGDIPLIEPEFLVDDLFEADALALFFGESGCKKSFVALDLAASIATGAPFHGKQTKEGAVIYLAGEGNAGMTRRAEAWSRHRGISLKEAPLFLSSRAALLMDEHSARLVEEEVDRIVQEVGNPLLIIIDTVARSIVGGDENSAKDVSVFVERVDALRRKYGASALLVHHSGIIDKGRLRGSSAWKGALDAEFLIESSGPDGRLVSVECKKMKDAPIPESFSFEAVEYVVLETRSGKAITSLALEPTDEKPAKKEKLSPTLKRALDSYHAAAAEKGLLDEQGNFAGVHIEDWRPYFYETATADSQSGKRGSFNRGIKGLVEGGYLTVRNDVYSLANPKETPPENEYGKRLKEVKERFSVSRRFNGVSCNASCGEEAFHALHHPIGCNAKRPHETLEAGETEKKEPGEVGNSFLEDEESFQGEGARIEFFDTFATGPEEPKADQPAPKKSYLELLTGGDGDEDEKVS